MVKLSNGLIPAIAIQKFEGFACTKDGPTKLPKIQPQLVTKIQPWACGR